MRLLVISYHHAADGAAGGLRWSGLARHLAGEGWETWFLTAAAASACETNGVTIERCPPRTTVAELYRRLRRAAPDVPLPAHRADLVDASLPRRILGTLRSEASGLLYTLSEGEGWTWPAARRARALLRRVQPDVVVSSGPPHLAHAAAWLATRGTGIRWIVDLRDPWAGPIAAAWREQHARGSRLGHAITRATERLVLGAASAVFTTTAELRTALAERYPALRVHWVPNAADRAALPPRSAKPFRGLGIVHVGTLYGGRDPAPLLRALQRLFERHPAAREEGSMFRQAGSEEPALALATRRTVAELGLEDSVTLLGALPRSAALELLARSRLAVVLAQDQDYQVPSKLYESLAMGIPTLVIAQPDSATAREGARVGAFVAAPDRIDQIAAVLEQVWRMPAGESAPPPAQCDYRALAPRVSRLLLGELEEPASAPTVSVA